MSFDLERGAVCFFNSTTKYGFIRGDKGGRDVFFHMRGGHPFCRGEEKPEFDLSISLALTPHRRFPKEGDRLVFIKEMEIKGPAATLWGFEDDYEKAAALIQNPNQPRYRLMMRFHHNAGDGKASKPHILWSGNDLNDINLSNYYHPQRDRPGTTDINGMKWWEVSNDSGKTWEKCNCPAAYVAQFDSLGRRRIHHY